MEDDGSHLVCGFQLAREVAFSQPNLDTFQSDGSVPEELSKAIVTPEDPYKLRGRPSESYTNDRREDDVAIVNGEIAPAGNMVAEGVRAEDGKAYIFYT